MRFSKSAAGVAAAATAALCGITLAGPASADPVTDGYVAVGSDTLQASMDALTNGTSKTGSYIRLAGDNGKPVGNFDAFGSDAIQVLTDTLPFGRPSGSGAGLAALAYSIRGASDTTLKYYSDYAAQAGHSNPAPQNIGGEIDIARSSDGVASGKASPTAGLLDYIPYARDAVSFVYKACSPEEATALSGITTAQLTDFYKTTYAAGTNPTVGGYTVIPRVPQNGSGTRKFFLAQIGVSTLGNRVVDDGTMQENDATELDNCGEIVPFSVANWIAQYNGVQLPNTTSATGVGLGAPLGTSTLPATLNTTTGKLQPNNDFYYSTTFGRDTYLIVEHVRIQPPGSAGYDAAKYDAGLAQLVSLDPANKTKSLVSFDLTPKPNGQPNGLLPGVLKQMFGFAAPLGTLDPDSGTYVVEPIRAYSNLSDIARK